MNIELFATKIRTIAVNIKFMRDYIDEYGINFVFATQNVNKRFTNDLQEIIDNAQAAIELLKQTDGE